MDSHRMSRVQQGLTRNRMLFRTMASFWAFQILALTVALVASEVVEETGSGSSSANITDSNVVHEASGNSTIRPVDTRSFVPPANGTARGAHGVREGKNILDWIGLGTGADTDPYLARANSACLNGDLSECFKSRALVSLDEFFDKESYILTENARVVRMPGRQLRLLQQEPFEFSTTPRADEPEWDQFVKFLLRKVERFLKSTALEVKLENDVTEDGRYAPRFIDEIASEIDILEDKSASPFSRKRLKKLFIPLLIILKLFKLKLLLFLPLILGLASFKKLLGFIALVVPGIIGFLRLCKPDLNQNYGSYGHSNFYHQPPHRYKHEYSPAGVASSPHQYYGNGPYYDAYGRDTEAQPSNTDSSSVAFRDQQADTSYDAHQLAYSGYQQYQTR